MDAKSAARMEGAMSGRCGGDRRRFVQGVAETVAVLMLKLYRCKEEREASAQKGSKVKTRRGAAGYPR